MSVHAVWILIKTNFFSQPLGVKRPTFPVGIVIRVLAERRQGWQLLRNGHLHVMSGHAFVIGGALDVEEGTLFVITGVDHEVSGALAVRRAACVLCQGRFLLAV